MIAELAETTAESVKRAQTRADTQAVLSALDRLGGAGDAAADVTDTKRRFPWQVPVVI